MAHFAKLDENNIVIEINVVHNNEVPDEATGVAFLHSLGFEGNWKQTSYNTYKGVHYGADGKPDNGVALRKNYGRIGYTYDSQRDAFIPPSPYPSWVLDEDKCQWKPPIPFPKATETTIWAWNEPSLSWLEISKPVDPSS
jgi:hypothetical protein